MRKNQITYSRTCAYSIQYHIIFCTKYRRKVLTPEILEDVIDYIKQIAKTQPYDIIEINGEEDHIHMLINATPTTNIPSLVKQLKGPSARKAFKQHPEIKKQLWGGHLWSPSYFVATINENTTQQIAEYIQSQGQKD